MLLCVWLAYLHRWRHLVGESTCRCWCSWWTVGQSDDSRVGRRRSRRRRQSCCFGCSAQGKPWRSSLIDVDSGLQEQEIKAKEIKRHCTTISTDRSSHVPVGIKYSFGNIFRGFIRISKQSRALFHDFTKLKIAENSSQTQVTRHHSNIILKVATSSQTRHTFTGCKSVSVWEPDKLWLPPGFEPSNVCQSSSTAIVGNTHREPYTNIVIIDLCTSKNFTRFFPFTPKSDQVQISPAAFPVILHHTVWRTWLFITYSDWKMIIILLILITPLIYFFLKGWENVLFELGSGRVQQLVLFSAAMTSTLSLSILFLFSRWRLLITPFLQTCRSRRVGMLLPLLPLPGTE